MSSNQTAQELLLIALVVGGAVGSTVLNRRGRPVVGWAVFGLTVVLVVLLGNRWHLSLDSL